MRKAKGAVAAEEKGWQQKLQCEATERRRYCSLKQREKWIRDGETGLGWGEEQ